MKEPTEREAEELRLAGVYGPSRLYTNKDMRLIVFPGNWDDKQLYGYGTALLTTRTTRGWLPITLATDWEDVADGIQAGRLMESPAAALLMARMNKDSPTP